MNSIWNHKVAIHCPTQQDADLTIKAMGKYVYMGNNGRKSFEYSSWINDKEETCYYFIQNHSDIYSGRKKDLIKQGFAIIGLSEFKDLLIDDLLAQTALSQIKDIKCV